MKKTLVIVAAVFLVAMAVGTALGVVLSPAKNSGAADGGAAVADSAHVAAPMDGGIRAFAPRLPDPGRLPASGPAHDGASSAAAETELPTFTQPRGTSTSGHVGVEFDELSRILGMLPPREAALFLDHLENELALGILRSMSVRQAALVIAYCSESKIAWLKSRLLEIPSEDR